MRQSNTLALLTACFMLLGVIACGSSSNKEDTDTEPSICGDLCKLYEKCSPSWFSDNFRNQNECKEDCIEKFDDIEDDESSECYQAQLELLKCVTKLSCQDFAAYGGEWTTNYPCRIHDENIERYCYYIWF